MDAAPTRASIALSLGMFFVLGAVILWRLTTSEFDPPPDPAPDRRAASPSRQAHLALRLPAPPPAPRPAAALEKASPPREIPAPGAIADGRMRLRLFEHAQGPSIEIAWPADPVLRLRLRDLFVRCFGMRDAVLAGHGELYAADSPAGQPWPINLDRYSGFVRQATGTLPAAEETAAAFIRSRHGLDRAAPLVRLFPRRVDGLLLGGLARIAGANYNGAREIRAAYRIDGVAVRVEAIRLDGRPVAGAIILPANCSG